MNIEESEDLFKDLPKLTYSVIRERNNFFFSITNMKLQIVKGKSLFFKYKFLSKVMKTMDTLESYIKISLDLNEVRSGLIRAQFFV